MKRFFGSVLTAYNEKLAGDLLQKKTYTPDYLSHVSKPNRGQEEAVLIRGHHESIIDRITFEKVQLELKRRSINKEQGRHASQYPFSGKIVCGLCGSSFVRRKRKKNGGAVRITWQCGRQVKYGRPGKNSNHKGCGNIIISEKAAERLFLTELGNVVKRLEIEAEAMRRKLCQAIVLAIGDEPASAAEEIKGINRELSTLTDKKHGLIDLYFEKLITKEDFKEMTGKYEKRIAELKEKLIFAEKDEKPDGSVLPDVYAAIDRLVSLREFSGQICRMVLDKMIISGEGGAEILLHSR